MDRGDRGGSIKGQHQGTGHERETRYCDRRRMKASMQLWPDPASASLTDGPTQMDSDALVK